jgi:hypothetical protein
MTASTRIRRILAGAAIAALVVGGFLVFEQSAGATAGGQSNSSNAVNNGNGFGNGHHDQSGIPRHCTDGHGHDAEHNKHCKPSS